MRYGEHFGGRDWEMEVHKDIVRLQVRDCGGGAGVWMGNYTEVRKETLLIIPGIFL